MSILAMPTLLGLAIFFAIPVLMFLGYGFLTSARFSVSLPVTFDNFADAVGSAATMRLALNSLVTGLWVAVLCVVLGVPVAAWIRYRAGSFELPILFLFVIAMFASYLVRLYAFRMMLGENGAINFLLLNLGIIDVPLEGLLFSKTAVVLAMVHIGLPWVVLIAYSAMRPLEPRYLEVATDLGASHWQTWWRVMFPLLAGPIGAAFILTFILASADYVAPQFLASPRDQLIGTQIQTDFVARGNWGLGAARSLLTLLVYVALYVSLLLVLRARRLDKIAWEV